MPRLASNRNPYRVHESCFRGVLSTPAEIMGRKSVHFYVDPTGLVPVALRRAPRLPRWSRKSRQKIGSIARLIDRLNCLWWVYNVPGLPVRWSSIKLTIYRRAERRNRFRKELIGRKCFARRKKLGVETSSTGFLSKNFLNLHYTQKISFKLSSVPSIV